MLLFDRFTSLIYANDGCPGHANSSRGECILLHARIILIHHFRRGEYIIVNLSVGQLDVKINLLHDDIKTSASLVLGGFTFYENLAVRHLVLPFDITPSLCEIQKVFTQYRGKKPSKLSNRENNLSQGYFSEN